MRLLWGSDLHLEFLTPAGLSRFCVALARRHPTHLLLGGDIHNASGLTARLRVLARTVEAPVSFVLGNHDYYGGSIAQVRADVRELCAAVPQLGWLPDAGLVALGDGLGLVGHGGWSDARLGEVEASPLVPADHRLITDFAGLDPPGRLAKMRALADEGAATIRKQLPAALERWPRVVLLTHVPPFAQGARHREDMPAEHWLPYFTSRATGDAIRQIAPRFPDREILVLAGHTHTPADVQVLPNVRVMVAGARYGHPALAELGR